MPEHPSADEAGYVYAAAVNIEQEYVDMLEASRQYQNNIEVVTTMRETDDAYHQYGTLDEIELKDEMAQAVPENENEHNRHIFTEPAGLDPGKTGCECGK